MVPPGRALNFQTQNFRFKCTFGRFQNVACVARLRTKTQRFYGCKPQWALLGDGLAYFVAHLAGLWFQLALGRSQNFGSSSTTAACRGYAPCGNPNGINSCATLVRCLGAFGWQTWMQLRTRRRMLGIEVLIWKEYQYVLHS